MKTLYENGRIYIGGPEGVLPSGAFVVENGRFLVVGTGKSSKIMWITIRKL